MFTNKRVFSDMTHQKNKNKRLERLRLSLSLAEAKTLTIQISLCKNSQLSCTPKFQISQTLLFFHFYCQILVHSIACFLSFLDSCVLLYLIYFQNPPSAKNSFHFALFFFLLWFSWKQNPRINSVSFVSKQGQFVNLWWVKIRYWQRFYCCFWLLPMFPMLPCSSSFES